MEYCQKMSKSDLAKLSGTSDAIATENYSRCVSDPNTICLQKVNLP